MHANLSRPHAGEPLEFDHRPDLAGDVGPDGVDERLGDRLDRLRLPDVGPAPTEAGDGLEAVMDGGRDHLLSDGPLERPDDVADPLVDLVPTEAGVDHRLADGLEAQRGRSPGPGCGRRAWRSGRSASRMLTGSVVGLPFLT